MSGSLGVQPVKDDTKLQIRQSPTDHLPRLPMRALFLAPSGGGKKGSFVAHLRGVGLHQSSAKPEAMVSMFAYRPLELAVETATINLIDWVVQDHSFTPTDAYCLVSTCPDFRVNVYQMVRLAKLNCVAGAELPTRYLE